MDLKVDKALIEKFESLHKRFQELNSSEKREYFSLKGTIKLRARKDFDRITGADEVSTVSKDGLTDEQREELKDLETRTEPLSEMLQKRFSLLLKIKRHFKERNKEKQIEEIGRMHIDDPVKALAEVVEALAEVSGMNQDISPTIVAKAKAIKNSLHG